MISLASRTFDLNGTFLFYNEDYETDNELDEASRRVTKTKTLDGGVYINDNGYTASDKTITIVLVNPSKELASGLKRLLQVHGEVTISMNNEVLLCVPESYLLSGGNVRMIFFAKKGIS